MKRLVLEIAMLTLFCGSAWARSPEVSLSGGDGSSFAKAIMVRAPTDHAGVNAQHDYIAKHFGKWRSIGVKSVEHRRLAGVLIAFRAAS